jgi:hypothetical protein
MCGRVLYLQTADPLHLNPTCTLARHPQGLTHSVKVVSETSAGAKARAQVEVLERLLGGEADAVLPLEKLSNGVLTNLFREKPSMASDGTRVLL